MITSISTNINHQPCKPQSIHMNPNDNNISNPVQSKKNMNTNNNQPQKKPSAAVIDKKERKQLWQSLAKYCDALLEEARTNGYVPTHRFIHPQSMKDNFIKLGLRPPNNPRGLEKFYDNFIIRCNYIADNNKNAKNKSKNPPKKWIAKGHRTKYTKKRAHKHLRVPNTVRPQSHNKIGSFPIVSQSIQHQYHQYHISKNMNNNNNNAIAQQQTSYNPSSKKQLRSELPAPRAPKIYSNSLTLLQRKKFGPHIVSINNRQQMGTNLSMQSPIMLPNEQLTPDQLMARYHAQQLQQRQQQQSLKQQSLQQQQYTYQQQPQQQQQTHQQQPQRVIYHHAHDNFYQINVGTPSSNHSSQSLHVPPKRRKRDSQSLPNKQMRDAAKQHIYNKQQMNQMKQMNQMNQMKQMQVDQEAKNNLQLRDDASGSNESNHSLQNMAAQNMAAQNMAAHTNAYRAAQAAANNFVHHQVQLSGSTSNEEYLSLRDHVSMNSSATGGANENAGDRPSLSTNCASGNTETSHFSQHTYDSRDSAEKEQQKSMQNNLNLRISLDGAADMIPVGLPHNVSSRYAQLQQEPQQMQIYYQNQMGSRTPVPMVNNTLYQRQNCMPSHARSQSATLDNKAILQQQYLEFNQLSPLNANQAIRTFARQNVVPHNQNKSYPDANNNQMELKLNQHPSFCGLQTVSELKEEIPFIPQYSPVPASPYNVNGVTVGMMRHQSQDSSLSLSSNLITPKITPSGQTMSANSAFFSPTSLQYDVDDRSFDYNNSTQSGYLTPVSPFMMQTLYEDNSLEQQEALYNLTVSNVETPKDAAKLGVDERHERTATPYDFDSNVVSAYHAKNNSLNVQQNNLIRNKLLDAQMFMIDSNASGASQWSNISTPLSMKSDDAITVGFINTDGQQVRSLFEFLQNDVKEAIILDLNAVRSRSSSMASVKNMCRHSMKQSADDLSAGGMVFATAYHPNQLSDTLTPFEITPNSVTPNTAASGTAPVTATSDDGMNTFSGQVAKFATHGVEIINENVSCKPAELTPHSSGSHSKPSTNSTNHTSNTSHSQTPLSPNILNSRIKHQSVGSIHGVAPHNDLDGLVIFEPVKTFEILDLYRSQMKDDAFLSVRALFEKTLQSAFVGCVKYLRHRLKHTITPIKYVFLVTFAMPNPTSDVSQIWYDLCTLRMEHIANTVRQCQLLCDQSKMNTKFYACITPIDANSFSDKTPSSTEGDIYKNQDDVLANYHFPNYGQYQSYLPFKNRIELSQSIRKTIKPQIKFNNNENQ